MKFFDCNNLRLDRGCVNLAVTLLICLTASMMTVSGYNKPAGYDELSCLPDSVLLACGKAYIEQDTLFDKSIICLSIVANRYYENQNDAVVRRSAVEAMRNLGNIYMTRHLDYAKAYSNLELARQIAEESGFKSQLAYIHVSLANLWQMNLHLNENSEKQVIENLRIALDNAIASGNEDIMPVIAINITTSALADGSWGDWANVVPRLRSYRFKSRPELLGYSRKMMEGADAYFLKDWQRAEKAFAEASDSVDCRVYPERYIFSADNALVRVYVITERYELAASLLMKDLAKARDAYCTDYELYFNGMLANLYEKEGSLDSLDKYYHNYLEIKEKVSRDNTLNKIEESEFLNRIERINQEVRELSVKRIEQRRKTLITFAVLIVVCAVLAILVWSYRNLRRNHRKLYERNVELLRINDELSKLRKTPEHTVMPEIPKATETVTRDDPEITDETLERVYRKAVRVMDSDSDIYNAGFRLNSLADKVGVHYRTLSSAINRFYKSNFNQFLIDYRIREAQRRMHLPEYKSYTLEAIAESVGFRSRTSFSATFKNTTGLTPSEYFKMAQSEMPE